MVLLIFFGSENHKTHGPSGIFITDPVFNLKNTPEAIINRLGGGNQYRCIKKVNYQHADIFNFEPEFKYSDLVIISCGVNDLARYGKRPEVLADLVTRRLKKCCSKHRSTNFVFTSILSKAHDSLLHTCPNWPGKSPTSTSLNHIKSC